MANSLFENIQPLEILPRRSHTRISCRRCSRKRDRGYISKFRLCRICFRELAISLNFRKV